MSSEAGKRKLNTWRLMLFFSLAYALAQAVDQGVSWLLSLTGVEISFQGIRLTTAVWALLGLAAGGAVLLLSSIVILVPLLEGVYAAGREEAAQNGE